MAIPKQPKGLRVGGKALWSGLATDGMPENLVALLTEACRVRDRLDQLDDVIQGKGVLQLMHFRSMVDEFFEEDPRHIILTVDAVMQHAATQAGVLKNLLEKIPAPAAKSAPAAGGGTALDQLAARRNERGGTARTTTTRARTAERRRPRK
jgi:hypothetical protein